jgi:hypothetical protein
METHGSIDADEAAAALASVRQSRTRVAWSGYPAWYWIVTGAAMGALVPMMLLTGWLVMAAAVALAALLVVVPRLAGRARGVREGWACGPMTFRESAALFGPAALLVVASAVAVKLAPGASPWPTIAGAALIFVLIAGRGILGSARAARR